ncbi:C40 family peptidase [Streptomyces sp. NPDC096033]|uniref:C40 family peptidase n=1 Tax=Streptomyces sp. NPDC096033 TaxID=3366071 RepID=UPI0037F47364
MSTPTPPNSGPTPAAGRLFGANDLAGQMAALTRVLTTFTSALSRGGSGGMNLGAFGPQGRQPDYGGQMSRLRQQMASQAAAHNEARIRMQEDLARQRQAWERQDRATTRTSNNMRIPQWRRDEAAQQGLENADSFVTQQRRTVRGWQMQENRFSAAQQGMQNDLARLQTQSRQQITMNRMAVGANIAGTVVGGAVGAAKRYYGDDFMEGLGQYGRRWSLMDSGTAASAGRRAGNVGGWIQRTGAMNWGTSNADIFGGMQSLVEQTAPGYRTIEANRAVTAAMITPGLGITGAAQMRNDLGTARAFYGSQMFGISPTRTAGGGRTSSTTLATDLANRVNAGNFAGLSTNQLSAQLAQGGSLSMTLENYANQTGMSGQSLEAMRQQTETMHKLMSTNAEDIKARKQGTPSLSKEDAEALLEAAAKSGAAGDKARKTLKDYNVDVGNSYQDAQNLMAGKSREGKLAQGASFLDAAKSSADTLTDIYSLLNKVLGPFADIIGGISGAFKGGGALGAIGSFVTGHPAAAGAAIGGGPVAGLGAFLGEKAWGAVSGMFGGAEGTPQSKQGEPAHAGVPGRDSYKATKESPGATAAVSTAIAFARGQIGDWYSQSLQGGTGPDYWDCSGLMQGAYEAAGISIPRVTYDQINAGPEVSMDELQPGDLVFYGDTSHVGMYTGNGQVIQAPRPGKQVYEGSMENAFVTARRVVEGRVGAIKSQDGKKKNDPTKSWGNKGLVTSGVLGSVEEVDALAAALAAGGVGGMQAQGRAPESTQDTEAGRSGSTIPPGPDNPTGNKALGKQMAAPYGWGSGPQWDALHELWMRESGWSTTADNPTSDAYGIPQAMSNLYPETATPEWRNSAQMQIDWGLKYIAGRYKKNGPIEAIAFHDANNWYDRGAWSIPGDQVAKLHAGEMVLTKQQASTVRAAMMEQGLGQGSGSGGGVALNFEPGAISINMGTATAEGAQSAAKQFVDFVAADDRIKTLMGGW